jgi:hypothetical protein
VRELAVILPDYCPVLIDGHGVALAPGVSLPRLPVLEGLLARARQALLPAGGWRSWVREHWQLAEGAPATIVAAAWGEPSASGQQYWLATPLHLFAGIDSVRVHPQGLLRLEPTEQAQLTADFARVFHDAPWRLIARDRRDLLLAGPALAATGADPATLLGADPSAGLPQGADAAALRALSSEIELWLYEHPVNAARIRRGQLPVTTLWLWGAAAGVCAAPLGASAPTAAAALPAVTGEDSYVEALWQLAGAAAVPTTAASASGLAEVRGHLLLLRVCEPPGLVATLERLEQRWLSGATAALRRGSLAAIHLLSAERAHSLSVWGLARVWRARRPWWQGL